MEERWEKRTVSYVVTYANIYGILVCYSDEMGAAVFSMTFGNLTRIASQS